MRDVVIPYKLNSTDEIFWCIKSLKNINHGRIIVLGEKPNYDIEAEFISNIDNIIKPTSKYSDQISKYLTACNMDLSDEIIIMNDDFYILEPVELENYNRGTITDHIKSRKPDSYTSGLQSTLNVLTQKGYGEIDYDLHTPMIIDRLKMKEAILELAPILNSGKIVMIRSYYGNKYKIDSKCTEDVKNIRTSPLISSSDASFNGEIGDYIRGKLC